MSKVTFSINRYDEDGDLFDECILIDIGDTILRFKTLDALKGFRHSVDRCIFEIENGEPMPTGDAA